MGNNSSKPKVHNKKTLAKSNNSVLEQVSVKRKADDRVDPDTILHDAKKQKLHRVRAKVKDAITVNKTDESPQKPKALPSRAAAPQLNNIVKSLGLGYIDTFDDQFLKDLASGLRSKIQKKALNTERPKLITKRRRKLQKFIVKDIPIVSSTIPSKTIPSAIIVPSPLLSPLRKPKTGVTEMNPCIILSDSEDENDDTTKESSTLAPPLQKKLSPPIFKTGRIELYKRDLDCLAPTEWLNDNVIGAHLNLLREKHEQVDQIYIFDSLFYDKLLKIHRSDAKHKRYYQETVRWFKDVDLTKKKLWIIPICTGSHWYTLAVNTPGSEKPRIVIMDSIQKRIEGYVSANIIKHFLKQLRRATGLKQCRRANFILANIPQQTNGYDCGLYLLRSATLLAEKRKEFVTLVKNPETNKVNHPVYKQVPIPTREALLHKFNKENAPPFYTQKSPKIEYT